MSTVWHCNKERERNTHLRVKEASWNIASLLSYLKSGGLPPPPLWHLILAVRFGDSIWRFSIARNYIPSFRKNQPKTLIFNYWIRAFWACVHENAGQKIRALLCESPIPGTVGGGGGWLGLPSRGLSPKHKELVFWPFLLSYITSGPFSCWYFLLLKQRFFWYYFSRHVMAIFCCVAQKAASAAH
jgi:hypothetical protein